MVQPGAGPSGLVTLAIDLLRTDGAVVVRVPLAGVKSDDLAIQLTGKLFIPRRERKQASEPVNAQVHLHERRFGVFSRPVALPIIVVAEKADARIREGILALRLPKA